jgi:hypothetical protein
VTFGIPQQAGFGIFSIADAAAIEVVEHRLLPTTA